MASDIEADLHRKSSATKKSAPKHSTFCCDLQSSDSPTTDPIDDNTDQPFKTETNLRIRETSLVFPTKEHLATIEALVNGDETLALIDSCSTASIISSVIAEDLGLAIDTNSARVLHTANGPLQTLGLAHFDLTLHPLKRRISAQVVQDFPYCLLLGTNIRKALTLWLHL